MAIQQMNLKKAYKDVIAVLSRPNERSAAVSTQFAVKFNKEVKHIWTLIDPLRNEHTVMYDKCYLLPLLTDGLLEIRQFYGLEGNIWCLLKYIGDSVFDIFIYKNTGGEIAYNRAVIPSTVTELPSVPFFPTCRPSSTYYPCFFTLKLTPNQASGSQLNLPAHVARYLRTFGVLQWILRGPSGIHVDCRILAPTGRKYAHIGRGWKNFCVLHGICPGNVLTLTFTTPEVRVVNVTIYYEWV